MHIGMQTLLTLLRVVFMTLQGNCLIKTVKRHDLNLNFQHQHQLIETKATMKTLSCKRKTFCSMRLLVLCQCLTNFLYLLLIADLIGSFLTCHRELCMQKLSENKQEDNSKSFI